MTLFDFFGWVGAVLVLAAYYMVSSGKAKAESKTFQLINVSGAAFLVAYTYKCNAYASMTVNILWILIGIISSFKIFNMSNLISRRKVIMTKNLKLVAIIFSVLLLPAQSIKAQTVNNIVEESVENEELTADIQLSQSTGIEDELDESEVDDNDDADSTEKNDTEEIIDESETEYESKNNNENKQLIKSTIKKSE